MGQICANKPIWLHDNTYMNDYQKFLQNIKKVGTSFLKINNCKFLDEENCDQLFAEILTRDGICYTFNGLDSREVYRAENIDPEFFDYKSHRASQWSLETGYESDNKNLYPQRVPTATTITGLEMSLASLFSQQDYVCQGSYEGFKVYIHEPGDIPQTSHQKIFVPAGQLVTISVKPQMMETSEQLRNYLPSRRQCYFNNERYLRFFKIYSENNCMTECLANYTMQQCGCNVFSLPSKSLNRIQIII